MCSAAILKDLLYIRIFANRFEHRGSGVLVGKPVAEKEAELLIIFMVQQKQDLSLSLRFATD